MIHYRSAAGEAAAARRALLILALVSLIGGGTIMGYFSVLDLVAIDRATDADATRAFGTVRGANTLLLVSIPIAWLFLLRWLRTTLRNAHALALPRTVVALAGIDRRVAVAALPGPLIGEPGRLLVAHLRSLAEAHSGTGSSRPIPDAGAPRWAGRISVLVAPLWIGGLVRSHADHHAVIWVALAWVLLSAVAILLRQAIAAVQLGEELQSALVTADRRSRHRSSQPA